MRLRKMNKNEVLELLKGKAEFKTKKEVEEFFEKLNLVIEVISGELEVDQKVKVGDYVAVEKKHVEGREGEINGVKFASESKDVVKIKGTGLVKKLV